MARMDGPGAMPAGAAGDGTAGKPNTREEGSAANGAVARKGPARSAGGQVAAGDTGQGEDFVARLNQVAIAESAKLSFLLHSRRACFALALSLGFC